MRETGLRLGIIGAGIMGERLLRAAREQAADSVRVAGIWDPAELAMARMARDFPDVPRAADAAALIEASDCVYVAAPPAAHLDHGEAVLACGRSLFCEKPLAVDVAAAAAFLKRSPDARAAVNFPFASSFAVERLRGWMAEGAVGTPQELAIEVAFAAWPRSWQRDAAAWLDGPVQGGFTREVVSHFLFLAVRLLGKLSLLERTASFPEEGRSERSVSANLRAGEVVVTLSGGVGTTDKDDHNIWTLRGSAGAVRLRDWSIAERLENGVWVPDPAAAANEAMRPLVLRRQLEGVARMTAGQSHHLATLAEAFDVQMIVEEILAH